MATVKTKAKQQAMGRASRPVFDPIHRPAARPGHPLTRAKPEERAHPAERKAKHKRPPGDRGESDD
ncbi:MAG TPA: hypothetical protein VM864_05600 [Pyrinomonadaceae bacterium]|nr:hypothetical protein [Pyrinomonadaceae bacterium]